MTLTNPTPGPALDARVAEVVMGWERHCHTGRLTWCEADDVQCLHVAAWAQDDAPLPAPVGVSDGCEPEHTIDNFRPSTDPAAACTIIDHLRAQGWYGEVIAAPDKGYSVRFSRKRQTLWIAAKTLPLAVCLAALRAVEGER